MSNFESFSEDLVPRNAPKPTIAVETIIRPIVPEVSLVFDKKRPDELLSKNQSTIPAYSTWRQQQQQIIQYQQQTYRDGVNKQNQTIVDQSVQPQQQHKQQPDTIQSDQQLQQTIPQQVHRNNNIYLNYQSSEQPITDQYHQHNHLHNNTNQPTTQTHVFHRVIDGSSLQQPTAFSSPIIHQHQHETPKSLKNILKTNSSPCCIENAYNVCPQFTPTLSSPYQHSPQIPQIKPTEQYHQYDSFNKTRCCQQHPSDEPTNPQLYQLILKQQQQIHVLQQQVETLQNRIDVLSTPDQNISQQNNVTLNADGNSGNNPSESQISPPLNNNQTPIEINQTTAINQNEILLNIFEYLKDLKLTKQQEEQQQKHIENTPSSRPLPTSSMPYSPLLTTPTIESKPLEITATHNETARKNINVNDKNIVAGCCVQHHNQKRVTFDKTSTVQQTDRSIAMNALAVKYNVLMGSGSGGGGGGAGGTLNAESNDLQHLKTICTPFENSSLSTYHYLAKYQLLHENLTTADLINRLADVDGGDGGGGVCCPNRIINQENPKILDILALKNQPKLL